MIEMAEQQPDSANRAVAFPFHDDERESGLREHRHLLLKRQQLVIVGDESIPVLSMLVNIFWLRDKSLEDSSRLPEPHVLAAEIAEDLRSALEQIESVLGDLQARARVVGRG